MQRNPWLYLVPRGLRIILPIIKNITNKKNIRIVSFMNPLPDSEPLEVHKISPSTQPDEIHAIVQTTFYQSNIISLCEIYIGYFWIPNRSFNKLRCRIFDSIISTE